MACGRVDFDPLADALRRDALPAACTTFSGWSPPTPVTELNLAGANDSGAQVIASGLAIYFNRNNNLYVSHRASRTTAWDVPQMIAELAGPAAYDATTRPDELEIIFTRVNPTNCLYTSRRTSSAQPWSAETKLSAFCTSGQVGGAYLTPDGLRLYYTLVSPSNGQGTISMSTRADVSQTFSPGVPVMVMTSNMYGYPALSLDEKTMYFEMAPSPLELQMATRSDTASSFGAPVPITELNLPTAEDEDVSVTADGLESFFDSDRGSDVDIYTSTRACL